METEVPEIVTHVVAVIGILVLWCLWCPSGFQGMHTVLGQETSDRTTEENSEPGAPDS